MFLNHVAPLPLRAGTIRERDQEGGEMLERLH